MDTNEREEFQLKLTDAHQKVEILTQKNEALQEEIVKLERKLELVNEFQSISISRDEYDRLIKASTIAESLAAMIRDKRDGYASIEYQEVCMIDSMIKALWKDVGHE